MMISIEEAIARVDAARPAPAIETVELAAAVGRVLAADVRADMDLPPFDRSQMDGFAVRAGDVSAAPARLRLIGESVAGAGFDGFVGPGETVRIMTGARVPAGADAVQKVEATRETESWIEILETAAPGQNINRRAAEIARGDLVFARGERVTERMIAALAAFGRARVEVFARPRVAILSTGSEIVAVDEVPQKDQIRNSNSAMLEALAAAAGARPVVRPHVHDDFETLKAALARAAGLEAPGDGAADAAKPQILIVTGGVSVGDYDFTKPALRALGAEIFFEKVSLKPGKPAVFARLNDVLVFGLPGNPVSVAVTFYLFARRAIARAAGARDADLRRGRAVCAHRIKGAKERDCLLPVSLATDAAGRLTIESLRFSGSSNFVAFARAEALVFVPRGTNLERGAAAEIYFL